MKRPSLSHILMLSLALLTAVAGGAALATGADQSAAKPSDVKLAKVILKVDGMTCGGCVATIQSSLADFEGIVDIQVDVSAGTTVIEYDSRRIAEVDKLAQAITASGYPATVIRTVAADQLQRERRAAAQKSRQAIAAVGGLPIDRADFEAEMAHARSRYAAIYGKTMMEGPQGRRLQDNLKRQVAQRLIVASIQLQEIKRVGYRLDPDVMDREFTAYLQKRGLSQEAFAGELQANGYTLAYFQKKFRQRVLIRHYIEEEVIPANLSDVEKQQRYADWFANARLLAEVTYYDAEIERLVRRQSTGGGCGSSCSAGP